MQLIELGKRGQGGLRKVAFNSILDHQCSTAQRHGAVSYVLGDPHGVVRSYIMPNWLI